MQKALSILLAIILLLTCIPLTAVSVSAATESDYSYTVSGGKASITRYDGSGGNVVIPSTLGGYPVTTIGNYAFDDCDSLIAVTIPDTITSIGGFSGCDNLAWIEVADGNTRYWSSEGVLFGTNNGYEHYLIKYPPAKAETIYAVPDGTWAICQTSFYAAINLTSIIFPLSVTTIERLAFTNCLNLEYVWYAGSKQDMKDIYIESGNNALKIWFFNTCMEQHIYSADCDPKCDKCEWTRTVAAEHGYDHNCDETCNYCGTTRTVYHDYNSATCTRPRTCRICNKTYGNELGHSYDNACDTTCNRCGEIRKTTHNYAAATCTKAKTCIICGKSEGMALGHKHVGVVTDPTCIYEGYTTFTCSVCNHRYIDNYVSAQGHDYCGDITEPDCINGGYTTYTCSRCGDSYVGDKTFAQGHDYYEDIIKPDCTNGGYTIYTCSRCGDSYVGDETSALGHNYGYETIPPTCTEKGYTKYTCYDCGNSYTDDYVSALGHNYIKATCNAPETCTVCEITRGNKLEHSYTNSCDKTCNRLCGYTRTITHKYAAATCDAPKTCKVCGVTSGNKLAHAYTNACDTTCNVCGYQRFETPKHDYTHELCDKDCNICGATRKPVHFYTDSCDIDCNLCGTKRKITHAYSNNCDEYCNVCGEWREAKSHIYSHRCDRDCDECDLIRTVNHKYSNKCDNSCNYCGSKRKVAAHTYKLAVGKKATFAQNGYSIKTCTECGKTEGDKIIIRKVGHVKLSVTTYTYNGSAKKPALTAKDSMGNKIPSSNYTITYASGRKNVGTYKVTIKFKGNYSGTKTLTFKINPTKTSISKLTAGKKSLTVKWAKKTTQVTGYEIQYSTSKSFKSVKTKTVSKNSTTSVKLTGLKAKTTYYVRVRTYKTVNGKKYYSGWSTVKHLKTK